MSFRNSSGFSFTGDNTINHVEGNQFNGQVIINSRAVAKRTKYDEFDYVKTGHIIALKRLGSQDVWEKDKRPPKRRKKGCRTIQTIELHNMQHSKYTAMTYEGEDAQALWKEDFQWFSRNRNPGSFQLFGINQSEIPALIFHYELIPCAHFYTGSFWMNVYLGYLRKNMGCYDHMVWMNTTSGMLCCGPEGPVTNIKRSVVYESIVVPYAVEMLKDDTCITFFSKFGSSVDDSVLRRAKFSYKRTYVDDLSPWMAEGRQYVDLDSHWYLHRLWRNPPDQLPMDVIGGLRFDTVYSPSLEAVARRPQWAHSLWEWLTTIGLINKTELDGGLIRFTLDPIRKEPVYLAFRYNPTFEKEWLSQCLHVFDALGVTKGMENFFVVTPPQLYLESTPTSPTLHNAEHLGEETPPTPIYLFLHPFPMTISELISWHEGKPYFWSFDESGKSQMSEEECERWRLPVLTFEASPGVGLSSYPTHIYAALRDWQKARGFDPTTSDWARSMGYPEWEIIDTEDRFLLVEGVSPVQASLRLPLPFRHVLSVRSG